MFFIRRLNLIIDWVSLELFEEYSILLLLTIFVVIA